MKFYGSRTLLIIIPLLFIIPLIPTDFVAAPSSSNYFIMWVDNTYGDVGKSTSAGTNIATYTITIQNYYSTQITVGLTYTIEDGDTSKWTITLPSSKTISGKVGNTPGSNTALLTVTAKSTSWPVENDMAVVKVKGTYTNPNPDEVRYITTITTMNSYEPNLFCEKPFDYVVKGNNNYVDYVVKVTNKGKKSDTIDLTYNNLPSNWEVKFYKGSDSTHSLPPITHTSVIVPGLFENILVSITARDVVNKYNMAKIDIIGKSQGDSNEEHSILTKTNAVTDILFCVSDVSVATNTLGGPHNVQPGSRTTFIIDVFNVHGATQGTVNAFLVRDLPAGWTSELYYDLDNEYDEQITVENPVGNEDFPDLGDYVEVKLTVDVPSSATLFSDYDIIVDADDTTPPTTTTKSVTVRIHTFSKEKIYLVGLNGVNYNSFLLNRRGNDFINDYQGSDDGSKRLWENTYDNFISKNADFRNPIGVFLAAADPNYIGMLTSTRVDKHGLSFVAYHYEGMVSGNPTFKAYDHNDLEAETIFEALKGSSDSEINNLKIAVISAKNWLNDIIVDDNVDISVSGVDHPNYIEPPGNYILTEKDTYTGDSHDDPSELLTNFFDQDHTIPVAVPKELARLTPDDKWIFEAAQRVILHEDPDFVFIINVEPDTAGHLWGSETDNGVTDPKKAEDVNIFANRNRMIATMKKNDFYLNELMSFLKARPCEQGSRYNSAFERNTFIVTADHGFRTVPIPDIDIKKILNDNSKFEGTDFEYLEGVGVGAYIYNIKDTDGDGQNAQEIANIKSLFSTYVTSDPINNPNKPIWKVLDQNDMSRGAASNKISDMIPTKGQPYAYKISESSSNNNYKNPDLFIVLHPYHQNVWSGSGMAAIIKTFGKDSIFSTMDETLYPSRLNVGMIGHHTPYSEAKIPLYFSYNKAITVYNRAEIIDIIPTISDRNGWPVPAKAEGKILKFKEKQREYGVDLGPWEVNSNHPLFGLGNPHNEDNIVDIEVQDYQGNTVSTDTITISPYATGTIDDRPDNTIIISTAPDEKIGSSFHEGVAYSSAENNDMENDPWTEGTAYVDEDTDLYIQYRSEQYEPSDLHGEIQFYNPDGTLATTDGFVMELDSTLIISCSDYAQYWQGGYANAEIIVTNDAVGLVGLTSRVNPGLSIATSEPMQSKINTILYSPYLREDGNWDTSIILQNPSDSGIEADIEFYNIADGSPAGVDQLSINSHGSITIAGDDYKQNWATDFANAKITITPGSSGEGLIGITQRIESIATIAMSEPLLSEPSQGLYSPYLTETMNWDTTIVLHNPNSEDSTTTLNFYNINDGSSAGTHSVQIDAYSSAVLNGDDYKSQWNGDSANLEVISDKGLVGITMGIDNVNDHGYSLSLSPHNIPPSADFTYIDQGAQTFLFDASNSGDPDGIVIDVSWDFGDDTAIRTGEIIVHIYSDPGQYSVTLTIRDNEGAIDTKTEIITV